MIKTYSNVLKEETISNIFESIEFLLDKPVWTSSNEWQECLVKSSSIISMHKIEDKILLSKIRNNVEKTLDIKFDDLDLNFFCYIYLWSRMSYITWHDDVLYPYNGTIYLNKNWDSDHGGIFLWKDNKTKEIKGVEPIYNTMVVNLDTKNDPVNLHCVTSIVPDVPMSRVTLQWRSTFKNQNQNQKINKINYS